MPTSPTMLGPRCRHCTASVLLQAPAHGRQRTRYMSSKELTQRVQAAECRRSSMTTMMMPCCNSSRIADERSLENLLNTRININ
eukprot:20215-Heterococcus_DN1.PRE.3